MTKKTETLSATEELDRLNAFHAEQVKALSARVEEERQVELEKARKAEEAKLAKLAEDIEPLARYCVELAERADKAIEQARLALVERQQVAGELAEKTRPCAGRQVNANPWYSERSYRSGLNANGLLKLARIDSHIDGQSFVSQDVRNLHHWLNADTMRKARA